MKLSSLNIDIKNLANIKKEKKFQHSLSKMESLFEILKGKDTEYNFKLEEYAKNYWENNKMDFASAISFLKSNGIKKLVVVADGESYILTKAIYDIFYNSYSELKPDIELVFTQGNINPEELVASLYNLKDEIFAINYISKSAISLESSIAFREYRKLLTDNLKNAGIDPIMLTDLIYITTDIHENTLNKMASLNKYTLFNMKAPLPSRYSALFEATCMFPLLASGINVSEMLNAYVLAFNTIISDENWENNPACLLATYIYFISRYLNRNVTYFLMNDPTLISMGKFLTLLINTSLNKNQRGLVAFEELFDYSLIPQLSDKEDNFIFTTFISRSKDLSQDNFDINMQQYDVLDFLGNRDKIAKLSNQEAMHNIQNTFDIKIELNDYSEISLACLIAYMQVVTIIVAYLYDIDPLSQPGVEVYKRNLYNLLIK
ncbi:glucose-6-phosphate isomerase [Mycoplasma sp. VS1572C]